MMLHLIEEGRETISSLFYLENVLTWWFTSFLKINQIKPNKQQQK